MTYPWLTNLQDESDDDDNGVGNGSDNNCGQVANHTRNDGGSDDSIHEIDDEEQPAGSSVLSLYRVDLDYNVAGEVEDQIPNWQEVQLINCSGDHIHDVVRAVFEPTSSVQRLQISTENFDSMVFEVLVKGLRDQQHQRLQPSSSCLPSLLTELILTMEMSTEATHALWHEGINAIFSRSEWSQPTISSSWLSPSLSIPSSSVTATATGNQIALQRLDLSQCEFGADTITVLADGISENCHLVSLKLEHCRLEDDEVAQIIRALEGHPCLLELSLRLNYCETEGVRAIADLLASDAKTKLQRLDIAQQDPGVLDLAELARALVTNKTMLYLDVKENYVRNDHIVALAEALTVNRTLEEVNLENCDIRETGWMSFMEHLPNMQGLFRLWIKENPINWSEECVAATNQTMSRVLQKNSTIHTIDIFEGDDIPESSRSWMKYLYFNRGGRKFLEPNQVTLAIWPLLLERAGRMEPLDAGSSFNNSNDHSSHDGNPENMTEISESKQFCALDILYMLLHGPALLER